MLTAPDNVKGRAESKDGANYAGLMAYSEREAQPRTYIQTKLEKKLLPGKKYCIKMHVQLSDLSKYAIGDLGMYISSKAIKLKDIENYDIQPQTYFPEKKATLRKCTNGFQSVQLLPPKEPSVMSL